MTRRKKSKSQLMSRRSRAWNQAKAVLSRTDEFLESFEGHGTKTPSNDAWVAKTNIDFLFMVINLSILTSHNTESICQTSFVTKWK